MIGPDSIPLSWYLTVAAILFGIGMLTVTSRRNAISIMIGVELILNAAAINFVAFSHYVAPTAPYVHSLPTGQVAALFIIVLAAAEAAVALAIVMSTFMNFRSIEVDQTSELKK